MHNKIKILFIGEAVSLAHISRPLVLANSLDKNIYELTFACDPIYKKFVNQYPEITYVPLTSISPEAFMKSLYYGKTIYDQKTLHSYVKDDVSLINAINPDLVIGDFRVSLSISANICQKPFFALANAHWSPFADNNFVSPETIYNKIFGLPISNFVFKHTYPMLFKQQAKPFNAVAKAYGQETAIDIREMYTRGGKVLYLDPSELINMKSLPINHHFLGPIIYSPKINEPIWLNDLKNSSRNIYATFGSSGMAHLLPTVCQSIIETKCNAVITTANRVTIPEHANIKQADYLPGELVLENSIMAICNGGSATVYQALSKGVPVIGIPQNMDQFLTMQIIEKNKLGIMLRPNQASEKNISKAINQILQDKTYTQNAQKSKNLFQNNATMKRFHMLLNEFFHLESQKRFFKNVS
jgi:UDP:flavonoid glycosyltransferase YjiC (YdhE family)